MKTKDVINLLEANKNEKGIINWNKKYPKADLLSSYGIGLTQLRKLAKQIGKNHDLAVALWDSTIYDAKIISILIDDPKLITKEQVEKQVTNLQQGYLAHTFSTCGAPLAKVSFVVDLANDWIASSYDIKQRCGYGLLYEISKSKKKNAPEDTYFNHHINYIKANYKNVSKQVLLSMGGALMGMGKRNRNLNTAALKVARLIGPIDFNEPGGTCDPFNVEKHLTSDFIQNKL